MNTNQQQSKRNDRMKSFRLPNNELEVLTIHAQIEDISLSHYLRRIVKNHIFTMQQVNDTPALLESNRKQ